MKAKKIVKLVSEGFVLSMTMVGIYSYIVKLKEKENIMLKRYKKYYGLTSLWLSQKLSGKDSVKEYLKQFAYKKVAIYGMGSIAELLSKQFEEYVESEIKYYIDKNAKEIFYGLNGLKVVNIEELNQMEKVDVIIVTTIADYEQVLPEIRKKDRNVKIISLEEIIQDN